MHDQDVSAPQGTRRRRSTEPKNPKSCHERALGLLSVRSRSRRELETRLRAAGFPQEQVDDVLVRLERVGLIDDRDFARQVAEHRFGARHEGSRAVAGELLRKGVAPSIVAEVVAGEQGDSEELRAEELAGSRASRMQGLEPAKAFGRLSSLLMRRGYSPDLARRAARKALAVASEED
jgi:regulatory protein